MTDHTHPDLACIDFGRSPGLEPFLDAAQKVAASIGRTGPAYAAPSAQWAAAACVRALDVGALYPEMYASNEALPLLFQLARTLVRVDVSAAWEGLYDVPASLLPGTLSGCRIGLPLAVGPYQPPQWALWMPLGDAGQDPSVAWFHLASGCLCGPVALSQVPFVCSRSASLLGMPLAHLITLAPGAGVGLDAIARHPLGAGTWRAYVESHLALLLGLLDGACQRLTEEAYAYAKERRSAGKPISHHQAVALRLADMALNQQALSLYLCAAVEQGDALGAGDGLARLSVPHVADLAFRISRDAVQIAAGHGYVEGLPFKRLFEQVGALSGVLTTCQSALATVPQSPSIE